MPHAHERAPLPKRLVALLEQGILAASRGLMCISTPMDAGDAEAISAGVGRALERLVLEPETA